MRRPRAKQLSQFRSGCTIGDEDNYTFMRPPAADGSELWSREDWEHLFCQGQPATRRRKKSRDPNEPEAWDVAARLRLATLTAGLAILAGRDDTQAVVEPMLRRLLHTSAASEPRLLQIKFLNEALARGIDLVGQFRGFEKIDPEPARRLLKQARR